MLAARLDVLGTVTGAAVHRPSGQGEALWAMGSLMEVKLHAEESGGALTAMIWLPKDVPHRFRVTGDAPARFLALGLPGGIEHLYQSVGVPADRRALPGAYPAEPELARWRTAGPAHGLEVLGPPLPA
jgi:hypothetical protein